MTTITTTTTITWHPASIRPQWANYYLAAINCCSRAIVAYWDGSRWVTEAEYGTEQVFPTHWAEMPQLVGTLRPVPEGELF